MPAMPTNLSDKYDLRVPRYTSYPTAPHFTSQVNDAVYRGWLETLDARQPLSLYFHIPFCDSMCWFADATPKSSIDMSQSGSISMSWSRK